MSVSEIVFSSIASGDFFSTLAQEILTIPQGLMRYFANEYVALLTHIHNGPKGIFRAIKSIGELILILMILPIFLLSLINRGASLFRRLRKHIATQAYSDQSLITTALFLQRIESYIPWVIAFFLLMYTERFAHNFVIKELIVVLPYFRFFILYKIIIYFLKSEMWRLAQLGAVLSNTEQRKKIERFSKTLSGFFFVSYSILFLVKGSSDSSLSYFTLKYIFISTGILLTIIQTARWKEEIISSLEKENTPFLLRWIKDLLQRPLGKYLSILALGCISIQKLTVQIIQVILTLEFAKKSIARFTRHRMEVSGANVLEASIDTLPNEYLEHFSMSKTDQEEILIEPNNQDISTALSIMNDWANDLTEESSLAIHGEKGSGKSTFLKQLSNKCDHKTIFKEISQKIITKEAMREFLGESLNITLDPAYKALQKWDKENKPTILMLDNAHNFFLLHIGGLEGFQEFLKIINMRLNNLFICATFNFHSWVVLNSIFSDNKYIRNELALSKWNEEDIFKLINIRQKNSGFSLIYDPMIFARTGNGESDEFINNEKRFFRILWEMACGNPRSAIYFWLSSLHKRGTRLYVCLPLKPEDNILSDLQSDTYFVYASVIKHENLTEAEAARSTNLPISMVRYALKIGLEREFITRERPGRYRIMPGWHHTVVRLLTQRNFLHD